MKKKMNRSRFFSIIGIMQVCLVIEIKWRWIHWVYTIQSLENVQKWLSKTSSNARTGWIKGLAKPCTKLFKQRVDLISKCFQPCNELGNDTIFFVHLIKATAALYARKLLCQIFLLLRQRFWFCLCLISCLFDHFLNLNSRLVLGWSLAVIGIFWNWLIPRELGRFLHNCIRSRIWNCRNRTCLRVSIDSGLNSRFIKSIHSR